MGNPGTDDWPDIDPAKWYKVWVDSFGAVIPGTGLCSEPWIGQTWCCKLGMNLINWLAVGYDCHDADEYCIVWGGSGQRIVRVKGPFDTGPLCAAG